MYIFVFSGQGSIWKWSSETCASTSGGIFTRRSPSLITIDATLYIPITWTTISSWKSTHRWTFTRFWSSAQLHATLSIAKFPHGKFHNSVFSKIIMNSNFASRQCQIFIFSSTFMAWIALERKWRHRWDHFWMLFVNKIRNLLNSSWEVTRGVH